MDSERQRDEVTALESIYNDEEFSYFKENDLYKITVKIFQTLPQNFCITYKKDNEVEKIFIDNLPPLILSIILPSEYPSLSPPKFTLRSYWLRYQAMLKLCNELNRLWEINKGHEVLFTWMNFLQNDLLEFLNIKGSIDIGHALFYYKISKSNTEGDSQMCTKNNPSNCIFDDNDNCGAGSSNEPQEQITTRKVNNYRSRHKLQDKSIICDIIVNENPLQMLIDYNKMKSQAQFVINYFTCNICFADKLGKYCTKFMPCLHVFCKECTASYVRTKIGDGSVQNILCPEDKCESDLNLSQVKELLLPEEFYKFDSMLLSSTLDMMPDVIYCPRRNCQYPASKEGDEKMATCPMCSYVFCIYCKMVYHGIEPCKLKISIKGASAEEIEQLKKRYGEKQVQRMIEKSQSEDWIYTHSQKCPMCYTAIEKADGCNKMTCWKCGTYFCWRCLKKLDKHNPYLHYRNPSSRCFDKLWPREYEDEENADLEAVEEQDVANNYFQIFYV